MGTTNTGCGVQIRSVADQLKDLADSIAQTAEMTKTTVNGKLTPIMNDERPPKQLEEKTPQPVWPLLFSQLRDSLDIIKTNLIEINQLMDRVEL